MFALVRFVFGVGPSRGAVVGAASTAAPILLRVAVAVFVLIPFVVVVVRLVVRAAGKTAIFRTAGPGEVVGCRCGFKTMRPLGWVVSFPGAKILISRDRVTVVGIFGILGVYEFQKGELEIKRNRHENWYEGFQLSSEGLKVIVYVRALAHLETKFAEQGWIVE